MTWLDLTWLDLTWLIVLCYSAMEKIILNGYSALGLMYFFTVGEDEVKAWTIQVCYRRHPFILTQA